MIALALLVACGPDQPAEESGIPEMSPVDLAIRASLDLRGTRPTIAEIERVEADPEAVGALIDEYSRDARFADRVGDLWSEVYLTRTETYYISADDYDVEGLTQAEFIESIGREPLAMLGYVAANDLPWTDIVTADWTMANEVTAQIWPIERPDGEGWLKSRYTDDRPAAGVLAMNAMWWRYTSTDSNANRKRANAASRILLCHDYLTRPIEFDRNVNLLDEAAITDALQSNPACVNCHVSLDPLASYFFGFWVYTPDAPADASTYHPDREKRWEDYTGTPPAYYGEPGDNLADLGHQIAADNRFVECAVEQAWELMLRRESTVDDLDTLTALRETFLAEELTMRPVLTAIAATPEYRAGATDESGTVPVKMMTPDLMASAIEDLTGYRWTYGGYDLMASDQLGFRTLAGGSDGYYVTRNATTPNATVLLVQERLAEAAASHVVAADAADPAQARLFTRVSLAETPDTDRDAMVSQLQELHLRLFGDRVDADGEEITANLELWSEVYAVRDDPHEAWTAVLSALLRDPDFLYY